MASSQMWISVHWADRDFVLTPLSYGSFYLQVGLYRTWQPSAEHRGAHSSTIHAASARANLGDVKVLRQAAQMGIQLVHALAMGVFDGLIDPLIATLLPSQLEGLLGGSGSLRSSFGQLGLFL